MEVVDYVVDGGRARGHRSRARHAEIGGARDDDDQQESDDDADADEDFEEHGRKLSIVVWKRVSCERVPQQSPRHA